LAGSEFEGTGIDPRDVAPLLLNLGTYASCGGAVEAAKQHYDDVNGCYYCANECHTT
jgi:hypothetical protein